MRGLVAAALTVLAFPASGWADVTLVTRELPLHGERTLAAASAPQRFNLVGLHWKGPGRVAFRVRGPHGWSGWHQAEAETEDLPDRGTDEARRMRGWRIGSPWWTGGSDRLEVRVRGRVTRRRANPEIAKALTAAIVHHTAGAAPATPAQSAAIVRGIYAYHVRGNGWDDIGYNFLVDRFGQVFEGRYGGVERNVIGAHAQGFNTGSVGIALIGSYDGRVPSAAERAALVRLLAWRLDVAHVDPVSNAPFVSAGNPKFKKGIPIFLRAVSGHRDTGYTSCPGARMYGQLGGFARGAAATGLPELYTPEIGS